MASVTITYMKEGTKPPLYLAGSFSSWEAQEMEHEIPDGQEEIRFHKTIQGEEGAEFQYKFRIGQGDWWVLDETAPVVTDDLGNRNNLLVMPKPASKMSDHGDEGDELTSTQAPEKIMADEHSKQNEIATQDPATTEVSDKMSEKEKDSGEVKESAATSPPHIPTLVVEKTDDLPSYGDDFGPAATVAEKDAHAMRSADAEPDYVVIQDDNTSDEAKTIQEVSESAALLDERAKTPDITDEEAGKIGLRRLSTTPIPVVASIAAEVAESAAILDEPAATPEVSESDAGKAGLRRMSTTPIAEVADTAAEVADSAANLDRESPSTPAVTDKEPRWIDLRRLSLSPKSPGTKTAAEEAASLEEGAKHIDEPAPFDDDDGREYPVTPDDEKAPLLAHEMFIPSSDVSRPRSPDIPADHGSSPAITPFDERVGLFPHERYIEPGTSSSPRLEDALPSPEPEHQLFNVQDFPTSREGIMALIDRTQRVLPPDEIRLTSPSSPCSPSLYDRPDVLTPGQSPRIIEQRNSPRAEPRTMSLQSIAEENDAFAMEDNETPDGGEAAGLMKDDGNLTANEYAQISKLVENPAISEQTLQSFLSGDEPGKEKTHGNIDKDVAQSEQNSAKVLEQAPDNSAEEVVMEGMVSPKPEFIPLGLPLGSPANDKAPAEVFDKVVGEGDQDVDSIKQMDGNIISEQMTPADATSEVHEIVDDGVSDDSPRTTPPTSSEGGQSYFASNQVPRDVDGKEEVQVGKSAVEGLDAPAIVVQPATPAISLGEMTVTNTKEAIMEEAAKEAQAPEPQSTPVPDEVKKSDEEADDLEPKSKSSPVPDEVKSHVHTQQGDTTVTANKADEEARDPESNSKSSPVPDETKTHSHTQDNDMVTTSRTVEQDDDADTSLVTENTVTQRKVGKPSADHDSAHEPLLPANNNAEQQPGFAAVIYNVVFGWMSGLFATLCGDRGKNKKDGKKRVIDSPSSSRAGVVIVILLVVVGVGVWVGFA